MTEYNQPFYMPVGKGKMNYHTGVRGGYYLPPIDPDPLEEPDKESHLEGEIIRLSQRIQHLERKPAAIPRRESTY